ncbi:MAG: anthranilate phosphoribosyltransferase [Thermoplasmata archaeon]
MIKGAIKKVSAGYDLSESETYLSMCEIMEGRASDAQISSFLTALCMKGETVEEIYACAKVMREKANRITVPAGAVDLCGTGGDDMRTFNISTISSLVVAGAGVTVAKHGNRSVSSKSGSADLMEYMGVNIELNARKVERCIEDVGIGFMFAPRFHLAMKYALTPRQEIGIRTLFNLIGPLSNPGEVKHQLIGVYDQNLTVPFAQVLMRFGVKHAMVVHGSGLDELTLTGKNNITELKDGLVYSYTLNPEDVCLGKVDLRDIRANSIDENVDIAHSVLDGEYGPARDTVLLNAGASLYVADLVGDITEGIKIAEETIDSGRAKEKLHSLVRYTQKAGGKYGP